MDRTHVLAAVLGCAVGVGAMFIARPAHDGADGETCARPGLPDELFSDRETYNTPENLAELQGKGDGPSGEYSSIRDIAHLSDEELRRRGYTLQDPDTGLYHDSPAYRALTWLRGLDARRFGWANDPASIVALDLSRLPLEDADLVHLAAFTNLRKLDLRGTGIGDAALGHLEGLTGLVDLDLTGTLVGDGGVASLEKLTGLTRLSLSSTKVTDAGMEALARLEGVQDLALEHTQVTGAGLERLKGLPLTGLALGGTPIGDDGLRHLDAWKLRHLSLYRNGSVTDVGLTRLRNQPELESLMIRGLKVGEKGLAHLTDLKKLKVLNASLVMDDASMVHLRDLTGLERLGLYSCPGITDAGVAHLEGLRNLRFLQLQFTKTGDAGLEHLAGLEQLRFLDLRGTQVTPEAAKAFESDRPGLRLLR